MFGFKWKKRTKVSKNKGVSHCIVRAKKVSDLFLGMSPFRLAVPQ
jgi:hypothetical protein